METLNNNELLANSQGIGNVKNSTVENCNCNQQIENSANSIIIGNNCIVLILNASVEAIAVLQSALKDLSISTVRQDGIFIPDKKSILYR